MVFWTTLLKDQEQQDTFWPLGIVKKKKKNIEGEIGMIDSETRNET